MRINLASSFYKNAISKWLVLMFFSVLAGCVFALTSHAQTLPSSQASSQANTSLFNTANELELPVRFEMLSSLTASGDEDEFSLGVLAELEEGWKIYWRSPGDAGLPPVVSLDEVMASDYQFQMDFPVPARFSIFGIDSFGYAKQVIFPATLSGHKAGENLSFSAKIEGLVCSDICIPFTDDLSLELPSGVSDISADAQKIAKARSLVPRTQSQIFKISELAIDADEKALTLGISPVEEGVVLPQLDDVFIEVAQSGLSFSAPENLADNRYKIEILGDGADQLVGNAATLTMVGDTHFAEIAAIFQLADAEASSASNLFLVILAFAFLGGLILNIMPCVLPVLLLKLHSLLHLTEVDNGAIARLRLLTSAAGILTSFLLLALVLAAMSYFGAQVGWGIQFQNILFLSFMAVVMSLFSLNMFDKLAFPIPEFAKKYGGGKNTFIADFMSGFFATLLATPCSAPFVGSAVSFAFTAPPLQLIAILMMMGLGLASPWIMLALFPSLLHVMPRPGRWMNILKAFMGIGLAGTVLWLVWLIWLLAGWGVVAVLVGMLVVISSLVALGKTPNLAALALSCVLAVLLPFGVMQSGLSAKNIANSGQHTASLYQPFTPKVLEDAKASGRPVFIDVTAAWCITCQVNKKLVLESPEVKAAFAKNNVFLIRADWTEANPDISDFLASHNKFAIPFNLFYARQGSIALPLPEILSKEVVLSTLDKAVSSS